MIHVEFGPSILDHEQETFWNNWLSKANAAAKKAIEDWEASDHQSVPALTDDIWKELKNNLLYDFFPDKCAYCEAPLERDFVPVEHYRPKGAVRPKKGGTWEGADTTTEDETGKSRPHPGYFWLAYHWKNLVPSCDKCNSGQGKMNQFPITAQYRMVRRLTPEEAAALGDTPFKSPKHPDVVYLEPDELDELEQPLLLHPYGHDEDDPRRHLCFGDQGVEAAREIDGAPSVKGKATIEVCQLHEDKLRKRRHAAQKTAWKEFLSQLIARVGTQNDLAKTIEHVWQAEDLAELKAGRSPYSAAALDYIDLWRKAMYPDG